MAQHDYDINSSDSISGFQFRQDTNSALSAIKSSNSGATSPTTPVPGMLWLDTSITPNKLKFRDTTNTTWLDVYIESRLGAPIASASTTTVGIFGSGEVVHITGTTAITSLGVSTTGTRRILIFDAVTSLVHNSTTLICPGASNITTLNGLVVVVICEDGAAGNWRVVDVTHPSVSVAELGYLSGVTSGVQAQLNSKAPTVSPTFTGTVVLPSETSIGGVSSVELGYLDGVSSGIQGQLDNKAPMTSPTFTGTITVEDTIRFSGATPDAFYTSFSAVEPTANNVVTVPNRTFTMAGTDDLKEVGVGQTWQNMTVSRAIGSTYTNTTGKPIVVVVSFATSTNAVNSAAISVGGEAIAFDVNQGGTGGNCSVSVLVPDGATYSATNSNNTYIKWMELR